MQFQGAYLIWKVRAALPVPHWGPASPSLETVIANAGNSMRALPGFVIVFFGSVSEELFFRGWLWRGLQRFWTPRMIMNSTALLWLATHMFDDIRTPIILLPLATTCSLARNFCGGVRASIIAHVTNGFCVMMMLVRIYL
jgi:membrane protease YdiL (CAAX protease family)